MLLELVDAQSLSIKLQEAGRVHASDSRPPVSFSYLIATNMLAVLLLMAFCLTMIQRTASLRAGSTTSSGAGPLARFATSRKQQQRIRISMAKEGGGAVMAPVRVRFAPSPTGSLHVGGARTALFNWLLAKKTKGKFLIRVEDTDEARSTRESETSILNDLKWMNMSWDEGPEVGGPYGPYRQSERKDIYKTFAEQLISGGKAYRCFCSEEELDKKREAAEAAGLDPKYDGTWRDADPAEVQRRLAAGEPHTVRFKVPPNKVVSIDDVVRGKVTWDADASLGDFIILRSSGMPVYNFCVAVDDANMQITHVIRAEEHLTNTLRQMLILEALGYKPPTYAHCSLILGQDRSKLSKRHGATSVQQFSEQGFLPQAMMNYLANLGWNDGTPKEIYSPEELIAAFDMSRIIKSAAVFDMDKLKWINGQHLRALKPERIEELVAEALVKSDKGEGEGVAEPVLAATIDRSNPQAAKFLAVASKISQRDMELVVDARRLVGACLRYDLEETLRSDPHVLEVLEASEAFDAIVKRLVADFDSGALPSGGEENLAELWKAYMKTLGAELGLKGKALFHPVRLALTGRMSGPEINDQLQLVALAQGVVSPTVPRVGIEERVAKLRSLSVADAKKLAASAPVSA